MNCTLVTSSKVLGIGKERKRDTGFWQNSNLKKPVKTQTHKQRSCNKTVPSLKHRCSYLGAKRGISMSKSTDSYKTSGERERINQRLKVRQIISGRLEKK